MAFSGAPGAQFIDVTDNIERKIAALLSHESQHANPRAMADLVHSWLTDNARVAGFPEGAAAEAFRVVAI